MITHFLLLFNIVPINPAARERRCKKTVSMQVDFQPCLKQKIQGLG